MSKLGKISLFCALISIVCMAITRYSLGAWVPFCWLALGLAVIFFGITFWKDRAFFKEFFMMRTTKEGMNMGVLILLMTALLLVVNYLGGKYYKTFDFSLERSNTLAAQSVQLVKSLDSDLKVVFFYKKGVEGNEENRSAFTDLVRKYQDNTSKITLDYVEVNERPDVAKEYGIDRGTGTVFLDYKGRRARLEKIDEQEFTSALVKVTRQNPKTIYFTIGHGEANLEEAKDAGGLNALKVLLEGARYTVRTLPLAVDAKIPSDADAIVIAGPIKDFQDFEIVLLEKYLKNGGGLFLAIESQNPAHLDGLVKKLGVQLLNNYVLNVVDTVMGQGINQGPTAGAIFSPTSLITKSFPQGEFALFRFPQGLKKLPSENGYSVDELVRTTPKTMAFATMPIKGESPMESFALVDEVTGKWDGDTNGKPFHAIVAGDVDFLTNQMLYQHMNRDLVLNSISALAKEENLISIMPKEPQATQLVLTDTKMGVYTFAFLIPLPILLLGLGTGLWIRRRNA